MSRKRKSRKVTAETKVVTLDKNVGATAELSQRHTIVARKGVRSHRVQTRLERWIEAGDVSPEAGHAGWRFGKDYASSLGKGRSAWRVGLEPVKAGAGHDPYEVALNAAGRLREAIAAMNVAPVPCAWVRPSELLHWFVIEDASVREIAEKCAMPDERRAKRLLIRYLGVLAEHYGRVDAERGRDITPSTAVDVLAKFTPPLIDEAA